MDDPRIHATLYPPAPFRLLTLNELQTPLHLVDLSALVRAEIEQIDDWEPETAGEVIFNNWD